VGRHRLRGIDAKLDRADKQLEGLQAEWHAFLNRDQPAHGVLFKHNAEASFYLPTFQVYEEPPLELSVICGEIIYNLRSALDHLAAELVEAHGSRPIRRVAFPISLDETDWIRRVHFPKNAAGKPVRGLLHGLPKTSDAWAYIQATQPYQRGNKAADHPLAELNQLSNRDKHRVVGTLYVYPGLDVLSMFGWNSRAWFVSGLAKVDPGTPLKHDTELAWFHFQPGGPDPSMRVKRNIPYDIAFGDIEDDLNREGSLADLIACVRRIRRDCVTWIG